MENTKEEIKEFSLSSFFEISRRLEIYHTIFYKIWELGKPIFTNKIPTAAVQFDREGNCIDFMFNPDFYKTLTEKQIDFIICHECLHVALEHGIRAKNATNRSICNITMDVVINEMLTHQYDFKQSEIDPKGDYCWLNTVFKDREDVKLGESFEYYYNRAIEDANTDCLTIDIHDFLNGMESDYIRDYLDNQLSDAEKQELNKFLGKAGSLDGKDSIKVSKEKIEIKRTWEKVIKKWTKKFFKDDFDTFEHWLRCNRRMSMLPEDIFLPNEFEMQEAPEKNKIELFLFLDTSGSCRGLAERFWRAYKSIPSDRFIKKCFGFSFTPYPINEENNTLRGFGGTSFSSIEKYIQEQITSGSISKYPDIVFIITDGEGDPVQPEFPERWHWYLSQNYSCYIPKGSYTYQLSDFE